MDALTIPHITNIGLWVVAANTRGPFAEASRIPGDTREAVARLFGVTAAGSVTYQTVESTTTTRKLRLYVIGYELDRPGGPRWLAAGRGIGRSHYELIADQRSGLELGDRISLGRNMFTVVGLDADQKDDGA